MENNAANNDCTVTGKIAGVSHFKICKKLLCAIKWSHESWTALSACYLKLGIG